MSLVPGSSRISSRVVGGVSVVKIIILFVWCRSDLLASLAPLMVICGCGLRSFCTERTYRQILGTTPLISVTRPRLMLVLDLSLSPLFDSLYQPRGTRYHSYYEDAEGNLQ